MCLLKSPGEAFENNRAPGVDGDADCREAEDEFIFDGPAAQRQQSN